MPYDAFPQKATGYGATVTPGGATYNTVISPRGNYDYGTIAEVNCSTTILSNTNIWSDFAIKNIAKSAIASPTVDMFIKSFNSNPKNPNEMLLNNIITDETATYYFSRVEKSI